MLEPMTLVETVTQDLTAAMKAQDAPKTSALRMAKAALKNREIDSKAPLTDEDAIRVLQTLVKQREDSIFQFRKANRPELVSKEEAELAVLRAYLPEQASDADIEAAVEKALAETGARDQKDLGRLMKAALASLKEGGKPADGSKVSAAVRRRLEA